MTWQWSPGGALTLASAVAMAVLAFLAWRRREGRPAAMLALVLVATAAWGLAYSIELGAATESSRQMWGDVKYVGICALPPAWVAFVLAYTGSNAWLRRRTMLALAVEPLLVLLLLANEHTHDLIRRYPTPDTKVAQAGVLFWPHSIYTYGLLWGATAFLVVRLRRLSPVYRRQSVVLVASLMVPFMCNVLYNFAVPPFDEVDLTPFAFLGVGFVLVWGVLRFRLVALRPVARSQVYMTMSDLVFTVDPLSRVVDVNPAGAAAFGQPVHRLIGQPVERLLPQAGRRLVGEGTAEPVEEVIAGRTYELRASPLTDRWSRRLGTLVEAHDVTVRKDVEQRLSYQALHDPLTGAANRTLYFDRLTHALDHAARTGRAVSVLFLDLDSFKAVNDELGHGAGDEVLVEVARRLRQSMRKDDTLARMGGDEFAILLEDVVDLREPERVAEHVRSSFAAPIQVGEHRLHVTASIGVATGLDVRPDELMRRADVAMYEGKRRSGPA